MKTKLRQDKAWLLKTAKAVAAELKMHKAGTRIRIRIPSAAITTKTGGWSAVLGDLGKGQSRLELWFDRITGYPDRKLYAALHGSSRQKIKTITNLVAKKLWPIREIDSNDTTDDKYLVFTTPLRSSEFKAPVLEKYPDGHTFYGIYDSNSATQEAVKHFCSRAVAFFQDVVRPMGPTRKDDQRDVFPRSENRKLVASHLRRERSRLLATECKIRDNYKCQVCGMVFEEAYGKIGEKFAEAHHHVPLSKLRENVKTKLEDLATVCANCHRMLHHMEGKRGDVTKLRAIVRKNKR